MPPAVCSFKCAPYPAFDESVKFADHVLFGCNGWPVRTLSSCNHPCKCGCNTLVLESPFLVTLVPSSCF